MPQNFTDLMLRKLTSNGQDRLELWDVRFPAFGVRVRLTMLRQRYPA